MEIAWTIGELAEAATTALGGEPARMNGRVRGLPNERLIRWYTTIGLVDPPLARRGRIALYGRRHLLQLVAVKRRQAAGLTIAQIQAELTGATNESLQAVARLPTPLHAPSTPDPTASSGPEPATSESGATTPSAPREPGASTRRFWTSPPATPPSTDRDFAVVRAEDPRTTARSRLERQEAEAGTIVHGVRLASGVTLLLDGAAPGPDDLAAIKAAAGPLLDELNRRGLRRDAQDLEVTEPVRPSADSPDQSSTHPAGPSNRPSVPPEANVTAHTAPLFPDRPLAGDTSPEPDAGLGALRTEHGNLPLESVRVSASIAGLAAGIEVVQGFRNPFDVPLEATYIFPLPDRAALTAMRMEAADRVIEGTLKERGQARADYDAAIATGRRASIAEEDRPDVFTMRVGNIVPGERVTVTLRLSQPLPYEDGAATFRFPLVVAPRYIPGAALDGPAAGDGVEPDTDAVPDASQISPPVLLPGFPDPVRLELMVDIDPAGLPLAEIRSSYGGPASERIDVGEADGRTTVRLRPGARLDRDFILRLGFAAEETTSLALTPDPAGDEGTFTFTVMPSGQGRPRPRDVALVLDRSGSMRGWKIVAARRAAARIIDTLTAEDRFAVLTFDHVVERPADLPQTLGQATDRNRFRAVEHLARLNARGGTDLLTPLQEAAGLLQDPGRDRVLVLITDGQVGNEDQILARLEPALAGTRVHVVGIDRAVNAGFLGRLSAIGHGRFELVESQDRLDEAMEQIHHRIGAPLVTGLALETDGLEIVPDTVSPSRLGALFPGVPLVLSGRWRGEPSGTMTLHGVSTGDGSPWGRSASAQVLEDPAAVHLWARSHLRELEDRYVMSGSAGLEARIVETSLRFGVLCRFTAFVAVDTRVVAAGQDPHRVVQPVELPDGWAGVALGGVVAPALGGGYGAAMPPPAGAAPAPPGQGGVASSPGAVPAVARGAAAAMARGATPRLRGPIRPSVGGAPSGGSGGAPPQDVRVLARTQLRQEADYLATQHTAPDDIRSRLLSDLRTRLEALIVHLQDSAIPEDELAPLVALVAELGASEQPLWGARLWVLWDRTLRVLTEVASEKTPEKTREKAPFWKRRP
jgi:Ca-activated chloride channel family protein